MQANSDVHVGLDEQALEREQPLARARLVAELEDLKDWAIRARGIGDQFEKPDPRFAQIQLACTRELARLYRLVEAAKPAAEPPVDPTLQREQHRALILGSIAELEARAR